MTKKLQVFISSTYTDMIDERQSAVEAILNAGHIPAGMELFQAGSETQLRTIERWIDESDVYILILGGRYGSIEPISKKSYIQLEYEYALSREIPTFAIILTDVYLHFKASKNVNLSIFEKRNKKKYNDFKKIVMSKIIKNINNLNDIQLAITNSISEFIKMYNFVGWVRGDIHLSNKEKLTNVCSASDYLTLGCFFRMFLIELPLKEIKEKETSEEIDRYMARVQLTQKAIIELYGKSSKQYKKLKYFIINKNTINKSNIENINENRIYIELAIMNKLSDRNNMYFQLGRTLGDLQLKSIMPTIGESGHKSITVGDIFVDLKNDIDILKYLAENIDNKIVKETLRDLHSNISLDGLAHDLYEKTGQCLELFAQMAFINSQLN